MVSLPQFSVLTVIFVLHISSVLSERCYDLTYLDYTCIIGSCCYGFCCLDGYYCCGHGSCCSNTLSIGAILGIVFGCALLIFSITALIWLCRRRRLSRANAGRIVRIPPQYAQQQQPYVVNTQNEGMAHQPYPTQVQYPPYPYPPQPVAHMPPTAAAGETTTTSNIPGAQY